MKKSVLIMFHLLFWVFTSLLLSIGIQLLFLPASILNGGNIGYLEHLATLSIALVVGAVIFYPSYFLLSYFVKKPFRFVWLFIAYIIVFSGVLFQSFYKNNNSDKFLDILITIFPVLYFNVFGFLFKTFIEWMNDKKIKVELEKEKLGAQLESLKNQINPHFLFNTLNNIDVLIQEEPLKASAYLQKLCEILRFMLYESGPDKISLSKEIDYIRKYIDLQKIRTSNEDFVKLDISGNVDNKFIVPMIFIHFLENAFKYATNKKIENAIYIKIDIGETELAFHCKNHINNADKSGNELNGIGIQLIRKRLDLSYKNAYQLHVKEEDNWYIVNLEIQLDDH